MKNETSIDLVVVTGPTASGKTRLAALLADRINGEIISADSRQVYRHMDLGTGKDYEDYIVGGREVPFHLTDIRDPGYKYNVYEYQNDFFRIWNEIKNQGRLPVMCGGTGLYIQAVLDRYKMVHVPPDHALREKLQGKSLEELTEILASFKNLHNQTDTDTVQRAIRAIEIESHYQNHPEIEVQLPDVNPLIVGVDIDRITRRKKITARLKERLENGMVDEVRALLESGVSANDLLYYGLEYKYLTWYLMGKIDYDEMFDRLNIAIHQFAKRQMTWFRGMERRGHKIHWIDGLKSKTENVEMIVSWLL